MAPNPPTIAVRLVSTYDPADAQATRRVDLQITGSSGVVHENGRATPFDTALIWPTVRDLLPPVGPLLADPTGRRGTAPDRTPGPGWAEQCRAMVALAVVAAPEGLDTESPQTVVRTWFATDDELWSATPLPSGGTDLRLATPGDLAELLVWDVTGALEALLRESVS